MNMIQVSGFRHRVVTLFHALKHTLPCEAAPVIPVYQNGQVTALLRVITADHLTDAAVIKLLAAWRAKNSRFFPSQFRVTTHGTRTWAEKQLLEIEDRILFMIERLDGTPVGHAGLYRFDYAARSCEIDNVVRGTKDIPGIMTAAVNTLCEWGKKELGVHMYYLRVFSDNKKAISLYRQCGFDHMNRIPLMKVKQGSGVITWEELSGTHTGKVKRYFLRMKRAV